MAVQTEGSRIGTGVWDSCRRGVSRAVAASRVLGGALRHAYQFAGTWLGKLRGVVPPSLYHFLTSGPLIRFVTRTLQRRIIFANLIGLAILLGGIFYLS